MHSVIPMRIAKIGHVVLAAILFVLGILLITYAEFPKEVWEPICGVLLIWLGATKITGYLSKDLYRLAFQYDFVYGFILIGMGLIFLARQNLTVETSGLLFGIVVFSDGVIKIQVARHARKFGISVWWMIFAFAILGVIGGLFVAIYPTDSVTTLTTIMGIVFVIESFMSGCTVISSVRVVEYRDPQVKQTNSPASGLKKCSSGDMHS